MKRPKINVPARGKERKKVVRQAIAFLTFKGYQQHDTKF